MQPLWADPASEALKSIQACALQADPTSRLACYDQQVNSLAAPTQDGSQAATPAAQKENSTSPSSPSTGAKPQGPGEFGSENLQRGRHRPSQPETLAAHVVDIKRSDQDWLTVTLDNGQTWQQSERGPELKVRQGDRVTIAKGLLGSYWLSGQSKLAIKVRRLR